MGFFSWKCSKSNISIPAYPWADKERKRSEIVLVLPDDKTVVGVYDGYGSIHDESGTEHDIYEVLAPYHFKRPATRSDVFSNQKHITAPDGTESIIEQFMWDEPLPQFSGMSLNQLRNEGYKITTHFDQISQMVKIVRQDKYKGEKYADLKTSPRCPNQGFFY